MAEQNHLELLDQGVTVWNEWRKSNPDVDVDLSGADLRTANSDSPRFSTQARGKANLERYDLSGANLFRANLESADLYRANLDGAILCGAVLSEADLQHATLKDADLGKAGLGRTDLDEASFGADVKETDLRGVYLQDADLSGADLGAATLEGADLRSAKLSKAKLAGANLAGVRLDHADLEGTDLRGIGKIWLDGNYIRETRFSPRANDPYNTLIREYTGLRFLVIAFLSILSFTPYVVEAIAWKVAGEVQEHLETVDSKPLIKPPSENEGYHKTTIWRVVSKWHDGVFLFGLSITLITYNVIRAIVTLQMSGIRGEEERNGYAPLRSEYAKFWYLRRILVFLGGLASICVIIKISGLLSAEVFIPK